MALLDDIAIGAIEDDPQKKIESIVKQLNEWGRVLSNEDRTNITKDDAGDQRLLIGFQQDGFENGNVGVKMSQEGVDVQSATDDQLIFSTDFNLFKIIESGTVSITADNTAGSGVIGSATVTHNLGIVPSVMAFVDNEDGINYQPLPAVLASSVSGTGITFLEYIYIVNINTVSFGIFYSKSNAGSKTRSIKYYLIRETAS